MRVGIDARMYGSFHSGLGRYVEQLIRQLKEIDSKNEYVIFLKSEAFYSFELPDEKWKKVLVDVHWYGFEEQFKMLGIIKNENVDLMHFPHWNVPFFYRKPFVVTIHDLIMFHFSRREATTHGPLVYFLKDRLHRIIVSSVIRRARHIFATSEFTKQDIINTFNSELKKISVIYQEASLFHCDDQKSMIECAVLSEYNISKPYVLYVGNAYPHKNLERLIKSWKIVEESYPEFQLVLVGRESSFYKKIKILAERQYNFSDSLKKGTEHKSIIFTGYVDNSKLNDLYNNAHLFVFPSLYEGFGLPPLEAMVNNVPVVSSNASCLPEVLGDGALYFDPRDINDMARVIEQGIGSEEIRFTMRKNAKEELRRYSWRHAVEKILQMYKDIISM